MKKIPSFFITSFILMSFFMPLSILMDTNTVQVKVNVADAAECTIISAIWDPSGEQNKASFYRDGKTQANIIVHTKNCVGAPSVTLTVFESDTCGLNCDDALVDSNLLRKPITIPSDNFTMRIRLGEEECEAGASGAIGYDCNLFFYIRQGDDTLYNSSGRIGGDIYYECDVVCQDEAEFLGIVANGSDDKPIVVDPEKTGAVLNPVYTLLAPIGSLKTIDTNSTGTCPGNPEISNGIGCYLNIIFKIAIGLCGALAVVMIVISSIQYMGDESVFGKTEAKSKILSAILGLLIALGAYALLNTISPDLLGANGVDVSESDIEIEAPMTANDPVPPAGTPSAKCPEGIVTAKTRGGDFPVCKTQEASIKKMVDSAWGAGLKLSGFGFRTIEKQRQLRKINGCPNIETSPASACRVPTAIPGTSMHESGKAFDLTCEGSTIKSRTNKCFVWLQTNAAGSGFYNLKSEPWHWSTTGH